VSITQQPPTDEHVVVGGTCAAEFEPVAAIFARVVAETPGGGAAVCVYRGGVPIVDLHGGTTYGPDSRQLVFSVAKAVSALAAHVAAERGELDLDQPVATFWPEFARSGTRAITARTVLAQRAGLPTVDRPLSVSAILNGGLEAALEQQEPYWEPGTDHGYHTITFGTLLDGIFQRALGVTVGAYVQRTLVEPLGLSLSFGLPEGGVEDVVPVKTSGTATVTLPGVDPAAGNLLEAAGFGLLDDPTTFNVAPLCSATMPAVSVVARARDLARLLAATLGPVDGVRILQPATVEDLRTTQSLGPDRVSGEISHFGSGVMLPSPRIPMLGPGSFGHDGHGGCLVAAHPETRTAYAFTTDVVSRIGGASLGALTLMATLRHCLERG
jgi:CubicO group peptidase (beta-lactamase class C family)